MTTSLRGSSWLSSSGVTILPDYKEFGGRHAETAALAHTLNYMGITAPDSGLPFSEALLFGIGGGIGAGYFVRHAREQITLHLATRIITQESTLPGFLHTICTRLSLSAQVQQAPSVAGAEKKLQQALSLVLPILVWADPRLLPYYGTPSAYHALVVYGLDTRQDIVYISDRSMLPLLLTRGELSVARQSLEVRRFRSLLIEPRAVVPRVDVAVRQGLNDYVTQMRHGFGPAEHDTGTGLKALERWAERLVVAGNPRGWLQLFPPGPRMYDVLVSAYDQIENRGAAGSALRGLFADFLVEAAELLGRPGLKAAAESAQAAAQRWTELSAALLPGELPVFAEARWITTRRRTLFEEHGRAADAEIHTLDTRLAELRTAVAAGVGLSPAEAGDLLSNARERVLAVLKAEEELVGAVETALT